MAKLLYLDLETSGLYPNVHGITQISGEVEIDGVTKEKFNFRCKPFPEQKIDDKALEVTGTTREALETHEESFVVFQKFKRMLSKYVSCFNKKDKFYMVGYNSHSFDSAFLRRLFSLCGERYYGSYFWSAGFDVMLLAAHKLAEERPNMPDFKLVTVAKQLGVEVDVNRLHDAEYDIEITKAAYKEVIK